jgi:HAD superfamily hydrolase (TIGR01509 family)
MRKYLLWDHDGVLVDTEKWYFAATQDSLRRLGVELDQLTYLRLMADGRASWELARAHGINEDVIVAARRDRDVCYQRYLAEADIEIEGVLDVLSELGAAYRMAIVTTAKREDFALIHRSRKIASFFEFVINVEDCAHAKPHPDPYLRALSRFGAAAGEAFAIEDSSRGLKAAVAAGLDCIIIRNEFTAAQDFTGAWRIVDSIRDLRSVLAV